MRGRRGRELLSLPVRVHGIQLGRPADLLVDVASDRVLGIDVRCGDGVHRFLPIGRLADIVVGDGGGVEAVVVEDGAEVPGGNLRLAPPSAA